MKLIVFSTLVALPLLFGCKKTESVSVQSNQTSTTVNSTTYTDGPGYTGAIVPSIEQDSKIPYYEVITNTSGGRLGTITSTTADLAINMAPPEDQGSENSCVAFAVGYAVRSYLYHIETGTSYTLGQGVRNDKLVFSPRFMYNLIRQGSLAKDDGLNPADAFQSLVNTGICTWSSSPYKVKEYNVPVTDIQKLESANYKIKSTSWGGVKLDDLSKIKGVLFDKKVPVAVLMPTDDAFQKPNKNIGKGYEFIVVVGYNDDIKAFKLMNSYGAGWANKGFIWVDYDLFHEFARNAYFAVNSLDNIKLISTASSSITPTGKIDIALKCNGLVPTVTGTSYTDFYYKFTVHTDAVYNSQTLVQIYPITPDGLAFYKIDLSTTDPETGKKSTDYKTFYGKLPVAYSYVSDIGYKTYDIKSLLSATDNLSSIKSDSYTPTGIYKFIIVTKTATTDYVGGKITPFPSPFFDTLCGSSEPSKNLYSVDF